MTLPATDQLDHLPPAELLALVKGLIAEVQRVQEENRQLKAELEKLRQPPANSRNSSQPPSRDQKSNAPEDTPPKKLGPRFGHARAVRPLVEHPDQTIRAEVTQCAHCQHDLHGVAPEKIVRRQITELPEIKPVVIETQQPEVRCPQCQQLTRGELPTGLEAERYFGPRLEATIVYLTHQQHLSYERIVAAIRELSGVVLSEGGVAAIIARAGEQAAAPAAAIKQAVITSPIIKSDETSARVRGRNWWHWVFIGAQAVYHQIAPRRNAGVITAVMGEMMAEVWVCDCFSAQLKAPAQLRDLQRVLDQHPQEVWAAAVQQLFREAIHLKHRFDCASPELTLVGYLRRATEIEHKLDALLDQQPASAQSRKLSSRFRLHRDKLLTFLYYPEVPPTNNQSEQALRPSVIHRKVTNGFRSDWGAQAYANLQSVIATAKIKGQKVFEVLVNLMGTPVLHFLAASDP